VIASSLSCGPDRWAARASTSTSSRSSILGHWPVVEPTPSWPPAYPIGEPGDA
jgi:hypothetical protein